LADFVVTIHYFNVILVLASALVTGVWGLVLYFRKQGVDTVEVADAQGGEASVKQVMSRPWRSALIVTTALGLLQGLLGVTLVTLGLKPGSGTGLYYLHYVYGGIVALAIPVALTYTSSGKNIRRDILIYSIAALILFAAGVRAFMTGPYPH
jgi:heme A synthase